MLSAERARATRALAAALLLFGLAGCGFSPLYAPTAGASGDLAPALASIRVQPVRERTGQEIVNELENALNPRRLSVPAAYQLEVTLTEQHADLALRPDGTPSRNDTAVVANFRLRRLADMQIVLDGKARDLGGHDVTADEYTNLISGQADETRALNNVGQEIVSRVALYFRTKPATP